MTTVTRTRSAAGNYSEVVAIRGPGTWLYIAGQVAFDATGRRLIRGGVDAQAEVILDQIEAQLRAYGGSLADVVKLTSYLVDLAEYDAFSKVRRRRFPADPPASAAVGVADLLLGARIEIEAVAFIAEGDG